jgi:hypothetical protein
LEIGPLPVFFFYRKIFRERTKGNFFGGKEMQGYTIKDESYTPVGERSICCTLTLENGYELSGVYCIDMDELMNEDTWKKKAFQSAYSEYTKLKNALDRDRLFNYFYIKEGEIIGKESV